MGFEEPDEEEKYRGFPAYKLPPNHKMKDKVAQRVIRRTNFRKLLRGNT